MITITDVVGRVRQSDYTGMNRCIPCTVLNMFIAVVIAGLLVGRGLFWIGIATFTAFAVVIYLRGYLVPGTPAITERYFPERVLRLFGKDLPKYTHNLGETTNNEAEERESVEALVAASVVTRRGNEIDLSSNFQDAWHERIHSVREREHEQGQGPRPEDVQAIYNADTITSHGPISFVVDKNKSVRWVSEAALVADVASATELEERIDEWESFDKSKCDSILTGLRLFLRRCPACDGSLSVAEDRIDPCCQKAQIAAQSDCDNCNAPIVDAAVVETDEDVSTQMRFLRL